MAAREDKGEDEWDEPTTETKAKRRPSIPVLFDDPTTEDEAGKSTQIVDAAQILGDLKRLTDPEHVPTPPSGELPGEPAKDPPATERPRKSRPRRRVRNNAEPTPAVGKDYMLSLLVEEATSEEVTEKRPSPDLRPDPAAAIVESPSDGRGTVLFVDEASLSPDERVAVETEEARDKADEVARKAAEEEAREARYAEMLEHRYLPHVIADAQAIGSLGLDHRSGFVLSLIDGVSTLDDILDLSGMPQTDALAILCDLADRKIVEWERTE